MTSEKCELIAHLYRRAGFGITKDELSALSSRNYEEIAESLLDPSQDSGVNIDTWRRYHNGAHHQIYRNEWIYKMVNTRNPLEEKMALFWHHVFATGQSKLEHPTVMGIQIDMLRRVGMTNFRDILVELSKDPAMIYWLDNSENHNGSPNENYGRELLELFSMGVGNYDEDDIKNASRAFTGWTFNQPVPIYPHGDYPATFKFDHDDHDFTEKTFLGETGNFNGEDIIDIIVKQPATARFVARHLYNFFVADEYQVPAWNENPPKDPEAIDLLAETFQKSHGDITRVMRVLLNSDFFKSSRFKKVKSPTEFIVGVLKLTGEYSDPTVITPDYGSMGTLMGQELLNPPTVEGWHTGLEWLDAGILSERVNFAVESVSDTSKTRVNQISQDENATNHLNDATADKIFDYCMGEFPGLSITEADKQRIYDTVETNTRDTKEKIVNYLQCIVSTPEYQLT